MLCGSRRWAGPALALPARLRPPLRSSSPSPPPPRLPPAPGKAKLRLPGRLRDAVGPSGRDGTAPAPLPPWSVADRGRCSGSVWVRETGPRRGVCARTGALGALRWGGAADAGIPGGARACRCRVAGAGRRDRGRACRELRLSLDHWRKEAPFLKRGLRPMQTGSFPPGAPALQRTGILLLRGRNRAADSAAELACAHPGLRLVRVPDSLRPDGVGLPGLVRASRLLGTAEPPLAEVGQESGHRDLPPPNFRALPPLLPLLLPRQGALQQRCMYPKWVRVAS